MGAGHHNLRFFAVCAVLFLAGGLLRHQAGWLGLPWENAAGPVAPVQAGEPEGLRETVLKFYDDLDRGNYDDAASMSYEVRWGDLGGTCMDAGLTSKEEFVSNATAEMGENGADLTLSTIDILGVEAVPPEARSTTERPELLALTHVAPATAESIYQVEAGGSLLSHCSPWEWHKKLLVARMDGGAGGEWRILLPGLPDDSATRFDQWFLDKNVFDGKTIICSQGTPREASSGAK